MSREGGGYKTKKQLRSFVQGLTLESNIRPERQTQSWSEAAETADALRAAGRNSTASSFVRVKPKDFTAACLLHLAPEDGL